MTGDNTRRQKVVDYKLAKPESFWSDLKAIKESYNYIKITLTFNLIVICQNKFFFLLLIAFI